MEGQIRNSLTAISEDGLEPSFLQFKFESSY